MKVLLFGANGQLGSDLSRVFRAQGDTVVPITHQQVDIRCEDQVSEIMAEAQPEVVLNTAAFHKVEECEKRPSLAFEVNGTAAMNLAQTCHRFGAVLVHFSTDYVFDGHKKAPYEETDLPAPLNVYGTSKVAGEHLIARYVDRYLLIRTCGLYGIAGSSAKGGNFVETMLKKAMAGEVIRVVNDQILTPTYTADLAKAAHRLILTRSLGLYHLSSEGQCSWYEFARRIVEYEGIDVQLVPVSTHAFPSPVRRPSYSVLSKAKVRALGLSMPTWDDALPRYLLERSQSKAPLSPFPVT